MSHLDRDDREFIREQVGRITKTLRSTSAQQAKATINAAPPQPPMGPDPDEVNLNTEQIENGLLDLDADDMTRVIGVGIAYLARVTGRPVGEVAFHLGKDAESFSEDEIG